MSSRSKKMRTIIPGVDLDKVLGPRGDRMSEQSKEKERGKEFNRRERMLEDLEALEMEETMLDTERRLQRKRERVQRLRSGEPVEGGGESLEGSIVREVFVPLVRDRLEGKGDTGNDVVNRALNIAERAVERDRPRGTGDGSPLTEVDKAIDVMSKVMGFVKQTEEEKEKEKTGREPESAGGGEISELERGLALVEKINSLLKTESAQSGEVSDAWIEFKKWEKQFEAEQKQRDRNYALAQRKQDKEHEARLAELGIEKERNQLMKSGVKRIGKSIAEALLEEDQMKPAEPPEGKPGGDEIVETTCEVCGTELAIPPEGQTPGAVIMCPNCESKFKFTEE